MKESEEKEEEINTFQTAHTGLCSSRRVRLMAPPCRGKYRPDQETSQAWIPASLLKVAAAVALHKMSQWTQNPETDGPNKNLQELHRVRRDVYQTLTNLSQWPQRSFNAFCWRHHRGGVYIHKHWSPLKHNWLKGPDACCSSYRQFCVRYLLMRWKHLRDHKETKGFIGFRGFHCFLCSTSFRSLICSHSNKRGIVWFPGKRHKDSGLFGRCTIANEHVGLFGDLEWNSLKLLKWSKVKMPTF